MKNNEQENMSEVERLEESRSIYDQHKKSKEAGEMNPEEAPKIEEPYYNTKGKKVGHFFIGFLGSLVCIMTFADTLRFLGSLVSLSTTLDNLRMLTGHYELIAIAEIAAILGYIGLIIYFMRFNKRKYIGIGMLSFLTFALIAFGGCVLFISSMFR